MPVEVERQPFQEAIDHFRAKVNVPTRRYTDMMGGAHAVGFMVAGANRADIVSDFRESIDRMIAEGGTIGDFRRDFDAIVARHGWSYKGERGWRTATIYRTNLRTAVAAGRYRQMTDPDVLKYRPYWQYVHGDSTVPRPEHLAWDGLVLRADDPWWSTHYGPNGWGCSCSVRALSRRQVKALGKSGPDKAPPIKMRSQRDPATGETNQVPEGIDPGWDYNVGEAATGRPIARRVIEAARGGTWKDVPGCTPADYGRPQSVPADAPKAKPGRTTAKPEDLDRIWKNALGADESRLKDAAGDTVVLSRALIDPIKAGGKRLDGRERYFPFLPEVVKDPFEIWVSFARNELTGKFGIRRRYVKVLDLGAEVRAVMLVAEVVDGVWTNLTASSPDDRTLGRSRHGVMVWGRK